MRIAVFSECYTPVTNGVVTSIRNLRDELRAWGHTVYVFAPGSRQPDDDDTVFRLPELPFPRHPFPFARPFPRLSCDFQSLGVQVIHCQHPFTVGHLGAELARKHGLPLVYTAHSLYDTMAEYSRSRLVRTVGQKAVRDYVRRFCAKVDYVIAPSRHTRDALLEDGIRVPFAVVPSGFASISFPVEGRAKIRQRLGIEADTPVLLCVGRIAPEKRVDLLLRALVMLKRRKLPPHLASFRAVIVGDGQCRQEIEAMAKELDLQDHAIFVGSQPFASIGDWYAAGDIFVLPSPAETQGLALIEAMAAQLPCVAIAEGGPLELVTPRETGLLVPFDPDAFADAIQSLLLDRELCRRMGARGRQHAQKYSAEAMARGVLAVYEEALAQNSPSIHR